MGEAEHDHPLPEFKVIQDYNPDPSIPKYKDQDVLNHPVLQQAAFEYLRSYAGDFIFLRRAKKTLLTEGRLDVSVVRGVLNCMRFRESLVGSLPKPGSTIPLKPKITFIQKEDVPVRRKPFVIPHTWKHEFVLNKPYPDDWVDGKGNGPKFHYLDVKRSEVLYYPEGTWRNGYKFPFIDITPRTVCGYTFRDAVTTNDPPSTALGCSNCLRKWEALDTVNNLGRDATGSTAGKVLRNQHVPPAFSG